MSKLGAEEGGIRVFRSSTQKTIEAAAVLLRSEHERMSYLRLLKLLYIADRESLKETGRPIIGGRLVAMKNGPLHSAVLDLAKGQHWDEPLWSQFIQREGYHLELKQGPGVLSLSRYEIGKLNEVAARHAQDDDWTVADLTHDLEEYQRNFRPGTSTTISWGDVIDAVGRSSDKQSLAEDAAAQAVFDRVLGG